MGTPEQPDEGRSPTLYGESGGGINRGRFLIHRRALIAGAIAMPVAARAGLTPADVLAARAIAATGGERRLKRIKALKWDGIANSSIGMGDNIVDHIVQVRVEPFGQAVSRSWIARAGSWTAKTIVIEADGSGYVEQAGERTPLSAAHALHERHQFAIYGHMLLVHSQLSTEGDELLSKKDGLPPIRFTLDADGRPKTARYRFAPSDGGDLVDGSVRLSGRVRSPDRIAWPEIIRISQPGITVDTKLTAFAVEFA